jgi:hypothetical protein
VQRETRINLTFLVAFLVLVLPGAVILFRKKLDPTSHRLDQPDPILNRLPYMVPLSAPPDMQWIVPDLTQAWVKSLVSPRPVLSAGPPGPRWEPVISDDHLLQILDVDIGPEMTRLTVLLWSGTPQASDALFSAMIDGQGMSQRVANVKPVQLPHDVRRELVTKGFVRPPENAMLITIDCRHLRLPGIHRLDLKYSGAPAPILTGLQFTLTSAETRPAD